MSDCPCQGKYGKSWHSKWGYPACEQSKQRNREWYKIHMATARWIAGSPILVDEIDPL